MKSQHRSRPGGELVAWFTVLLVSSDAFRIRLELRKRSRCPRLQLRSRKDQHMRLDTPGSASETFSAWTLSTLAASFRTGRACRYIHDPFAIITSPFLRAEEGPVASRREVRTGLPHMFAWPSVLFRQSNPPTHSKIPNSIVDQLNHAPS